MRTTKNKIYLFKSDADRILKEELQLLREKKEWIVEPDKAINFLLTAKDTDREVQTSWNSQDPLYSNFLAMYGKHVAVPPKNDLKDDVATMNNMDDIISTFKASNDPRLAILISIINGYEQFIPKSQLLDALQNDSNKQRASLWFFAYGILHYGRSFKSDPENAPQDLKEYAKTASTIDKKLTNQFLNKITGGKITSDDIGFTPGAYFSNSTNTFQNTSMSDLQAVNTNSPVNQYKKLSQTQEQNIVKYISKIAHTNSNPDAKKAIEDIKQNKYSAYEMVSKNLQDANELDSNYYISNSNDAYMILRLLDQLPLQGNKIVLANGEAMKNISAKKIGTSKDKTSLNRYTFADSNVVSRFVTEAVSMNDVQLSTVIYLRIADLEDDQKKQLCSTVFNYTRNYKYVSSILKNPIGDPQTYLDPDSITDGLTKGKRSKSAAILLQTLGKNDKYQNLKFSDEQLKSIVYLVDNDVAEKLHTQLTNASTDYAKKIVNVLTAKVPNSGQGIGSKGQGQGSEDEITV